MQDSDGWRDTLRALRRLEFTEPAIVDLVRVTMAVTQPEILTSHSEQVLHLGNVVLETDAKVAACLSSIHGR
jgi:hypothetical protein